MYGNCIRCFVLSVIGSNLNVTDNYYYAKDHLFINRILHFVPTKCINCMLNQYRFDIN